MKTADFELHSAVNYGRSKTDADRGGFLADERARIFQLRDNRTRSRESPSVSLLTEGSCIRQLLRTVRDVNLFFR